MRARGSEAISASEAVVIHYAGRPIAARRGETIAAALTAEGILHLRTTSQDAQRGLFCGMGVCQDCLVTVDGAPRQRACMTKIIGPVEITPQEPRPEAVSLNVSAQETQRDALTPDVLVIGGGAGGLAAATALARYGVDVMLADDRPQPGGQYYKQLMTTPDLPFKQHADRQMDAGVKRLDEARRTGVRFLSGCEIAGAFAPMSFVSITGSTARLIRPKRVVVATGAFERAMPVPGWTLPGVMATGAVQTLLRSYRVLAGRRVIVAGNGPLNLQVALELVRAGAVVPALAELARSPWQAPWRSVLDMAVGSPRHLVQGLAMLAEARAMSIPIYFGVRLLGVERGAAGLRAHFGSPSPGGQVITRDADIVAIGYGFRPSDEILRMLGCQFAGSSAGEPLLDRSERFETSLPGVFAVGDCARFGGAAVAELEGQLVGLAIAQDLGRIDSVYASHLQAPLRKRLARQRRFQSGLWQAYGASDSNPLSINPSTPVCRCEVVSVGDLEAAVASGAIMMGSLKRQTRIGMGPCQGRYCGEFARRLAGRALSKGPITSDALTWAPRPPIKPLPVGVLADLELGIDGD